MRWYRDRRTAAATAADAIAHPAATSTRKTVPRGLVTLNEALVEAEREKLLPLSEQSQARRPPLKRDDENSVSRNSSNSSSGKHNLSIEQWPKSGKSDFSAIHGYTLPCATDMTQRRHLIDQGKPPLGAGHLSARYTPTQLVEVPDFHTHPLPHNPLPQNGRFNAPTADLFSSSYKPIPRQLHLASH